MTAPGGNFRESNDKDTSLSPRTEKEVKHGAVPIDVHGSGARVTDFDRFQRWLVAERAISETSAADYAGEVRRSLEDRSAPLGRLLDAEFAPKTRRKLLQALRQWAIFSGDRELEKRLAKTSPLVKRLPRGDRASMRPPFPKEEWKRFLTMLERAEEKLGCPRAVWATIGIIAHRGPRVGDAVRLSRHQVRAAVETGRANFAGKGQKQLEYDVEICRAHLEALDAMTNWHRVWNLVSPKAEDPYRSARFAVWSWCKRIGEAAGLQPPLYTHRFRRTVAVEFLKKLHGDPFAIIKVMKWMGWASMETAKHYLDHVSGEELDRVGRSLLD